MDLTENRESAATTSRLRLMQREFMVGDWVCLGLFGVIAKFVVTEFIA
jgi:hypothetical protein